jgi:hypothetical protein
VEELAMKQTRLHWEICTAALCATLVGFQLQALQPVFTGNVESDFVGPCVTIVPDPEDVVMGDQFGSAISGFDIKDIRFCYDASNDTLYVGINSFGIAGDADGDGDPGGSSQALIRSLGVDLPDFGGSESFFVLVDAGVDGTYDIVVGVPRCSSMVESCGFGAATVDWFADTAPFGAPIPEHTGSFFASPTRDAPDLEFTVPNLSLLAGLVASADEYTMQVIAFMGSTVDDGIGEDYVFAGQIYLPITSSIGDWVWEDLNGNGIQEEGEPPIPGVTLDLLDANGTVIGTRTTDMNGWYTFGGLAAGSCTVAVTDTAHVLDTFALTTANDPYPYALALGEHHLDADFGYIRPQLGPSLIVTKSFEKVCPDVPCGECRGKITELTLRYTGATSAFVEVVQKKDGVIFGDTVEPDEEFTFFGADDKGTMGTEITLLVDGAEHTAIHTSCSQPIGPGLTKGDFTVVAGYSLEGGELCPVEDDPGGDSGCGECKGKITELTLRYTGATSAFVEVVQKKDGVIFGDTVEPDEELTFFCADDKGTMGTEITLLVDGAEHTAIHTSCSQPIGPGLTKGDFTVVAGYSLEGGELCPVEDDPGGDSGCGECKGKITELTLRYTGTASAFVEVVQKKDGVIFGDTVEPDEEFTIFGADDRGTMGTEITLLVDGAEHTAIHTSCSQPIGPGLTKGDFTVVAGYSLQGGELCPVTDDSSGGGKPPKGKHDKHSKTVYVPCDPDRIGVGDDILFTITVTATSPLGGDVIQIRDCVDSSLSIVETVPAAAVDGNVLSWDLVLPAGDSVTELLVTAILADVPAVDNDDPVGPEWLCTDYAEMPVIVKVPCVDGSLGVLTEKQWQSHPEAWPVEVIEVGGLSYSKDVAIAIMSQKGGGKVLKVFRALVAAKLNVLTGNEDSCIADTIDAADSWLSQYPVGSHVGKKEWKGVEALHRKLEEYNRGRLCATARDKKHKGKPELCDAVVPLLNRACFRLVR